MKYIISIILAILTISCANQISTYKYNIKKVFTRQQVDSLCLVDTLPVIELWNKFPIIDYETKNTFNEYLFVKNDSIYRAEYYKEDSIKVTKRIKK